MASGKKSILVIQSRILEVEEELQGIEEHEIAAHITVPHEGGWGWVVVFSAFFSIFVLDGVAYTVGAMLSDIAKDFKVSDSLIALVNSTAVSLYFMASPLASALINRFGFRACAMSGSIICSLSLFTTQFVPKYPYFFLFYGLFAGLGYSLINMSSGLVVGFYFERLRSVALAIASCGSSIGVMSMFPLNAYLVKLGGWRTTTLLHSGFFGVVFFLGMAYRPLLSLTIAKSEKDEDIVTRTIAYLPSVTSAASSALATSTSRPALIPTATERLFSAVSNYNFPTAAEVIQEVSEVDIKDIIKNEQPGPSTVSPSKSKSKITLIPHTVDGALSEKHLKQVQSIISRTSDSKKMTELSIEPTKQPRKKRNCLQRLLHWEPHIHQARPLYRDDAFYAGKLRDLPQYQKSMVDTREKGTGLEYQMAVTRATALHDLEDRRGVFTTAIRRVLATMMDPKLLKRKSFLLLCCSGFFTYMGFLVPYVFLKDRNQTAGIDPKHCNLFISVIGISNACGRLALGSLASKIDPLKLFSFFCVLAGISTIASNASDNVYFQYSYCFIFGFSISSVACLRSVILVSLYGLDKLTNATGMMLIFLGLGNLMSTPLAGVIKNNYGYALAFYIAGSFITISGVVLIPVKCFANREQKAIDDIEVIGKEQVNVKTSQQMKKKGRKGK